MGKRKTAMADRIKKEKETQYFAILRNNPTSTRKMRLVADLIRGKGAFDALNILKFSKQEASVKLEKLLKSAINNYEQKTGQRADDSELVVKEIVVEQSVTIKRFLPAPQGRAYRLRKRSNHVRISVDSKNAPAVPVNEVEEVAAEA